MARPALMCSRALTASLLASCTLDAWSPPRDARADVVLDAVVDAPPADARPTCAEPAGRSLSAGAHGAGCAVLCAGDVWCWGRNLAGQLGDGTTSSRATPVSVGVAVSDSSLVAINYGHACAVARGSAWCWGENTQGALGNGSTESSLRAVAVMGLKHPVVSIATGGLHTCAVLMTGEVSCWGHNERGQLGDGSGSRRVSPRNVQGLGPAASVVAGQFHTCALLRSGEVSCWGQNAFGTLADGTHMDNPNPRVVSLRRPASALASTSNHVCAVVDGDVWCWGHNQDGQVGDETRPLRVTLPTPVRVSTLGGTARLVAAGTAHTCALLMDGSVRCWGAGNRGQIGDGGMAARLTPATVMGLDAPAVAVAAGDSISCAGLRDGRVMCWGANDEGQLGVGSPGDRATPVETTLPR